MDKIHITKQCSKCKQIKSISDFRQRTDSKDGYRHQCKKCLGFYINQWYKTEKGKKRMHIHNLKYKIDHPDRRKAHKEVNNAVRAGKLSRPSNYHCRYCWNPAQQYHHHLGYTPENWFNVIPVCRICHTNLHRQ
jgi:hypothetical protein